MNFGMILVTVATIPAILVGFLFPAYLIDAVRLTDEEKAIATQKGWTLA